MSKKAWIYTLLVGQIFLWTGSAFISVLYKLLNYYEPAAVTLYTEVLYYILQAAGIALFAIILKIKPSLAGKRSFVIFAIVLTVLFTAAALLFDIGWLVMSSGLLMNLGIGMLSGAYLTRLSTHIPQQSRGRAFGYSYAIGSIGTWLLSLPDSGILLQGGLAIYVFVGMAAISVALVRWLEPITDDNGQWQTEIVRLDKKLILVVLSIPLVCSIVNGLGCYFSAADVSTVLNSAFTRIFYAVGLVVAGIVNDRNRRYGAICCITALIFPFVSLALHNEVGISAFLSVFSYIFYGFFSVYRVVLFADLAGKRSSYLFLAVFGLLSGRLGDAIGTLGGIMTSGNQLLLTCASAGVFIVCAILFFNLYHELYMPRLSEKENTEALLSEYEARYELVARQSEIFRLVVKGCSNAEISSELFLSGNTVKYHMKNILRKTGCSNRTELIATFKKSTK
ncbi:MAG: LuxR family transcriptional regulator [Oscillospiraceae bacterium]|nr:LuxR family transcriptional regulator [Oscillospiraceae bacterium]